MRNIKIKDDKTTIEFLDEVISSKRNRNTNDIFDNYRDRINTLRPNFTNPFNQFELNHANNNLENITSIKNTFSPNQIADIQELYNPKNSKILNFKKKLKIDDDYYADTNCQYCTISSGNTLDHILPQNDFPEFVVNHMNLLPICGECNSTKNKYFLNEEGQRIFLNLYTDILPQQQYLFVNIDFNNDIVNVDFNLNNRNMIDISMYNLINRHFKALKLLKRFKEQSVIIIKEFQNSINLLLGVIDDFQIVQITTSKINSNKKLLGNNHYKNILEQALIQHPNFFTWIRSL